MQVRLADPTLLRSWADFLERAGYTALPETSETIDFVPPAALSMELLRPISACTSPRGPL